MIESSIHPDRFVRRHIGPSPEDIELMLKALDQRSLSELSNSIVPTSILQDRILDIPEAFSEVEVLSQLKSLASRNQISEIT